MTRPCNRCGGTNRYASNGKCVTCVAADGAARHARAIDRNGNYRAGLKDGFVRFGTLAHRILRHIHVAGPSLHADLVEARPGEIGLSANLGRLVRHGLLHRAGRQSFRSGVGSGHLFSIEKPTRHEAQARPHTPEARQSRYRAARKLKVSSVFDYRGGMTL